MKKYALTMNGRNFLIEMDGKAAKRGFFQSFYLEAESPDEAVQMAVLKIQKNEGIKAITRNSRDDSPMAFLDTIGEIESFDGVETMESPIMWYPEKKWWQFWK